MIWITKGAANTVDVTLSEKTTVTEPVYLFEFISAAKKKVYCIAADISEHPARYNRFVITEKSDPDPLAGEVEMSLEGQWKYKIYEQESADNLDPELAGDIVETGRVQVAWADSNDIIYEPDTVEDKVYQG